MNKKKIHNNDDNQVNDNSQIQIRNNLKIRSGKTIFIYSRRHFLLAEDFFVVAEDILNKKKG